MWNLWSNLHRDLNNCQQEEGKVHAGQLYQPQRGLSLHLSTLQHVLRGTDWAGSFSKSHPAPSMLQESYCKENNLALDSESTHTRFLSSQTS